MDQDERQRGALDLESLEFGIRSRMLSVGASALEGIVNAGQGGYQGSSIPCPCGAKARFVEYREKQLRTVLGPLRVRRAYYHCANCGQGKAPLDGTLDVIATSFSPGLRRLSCRVGAKDSFALGSEDLRELAGIEVKTKEVERCSEKVGAEIQAVEHRRREEIFSGKVVPLPLEEPPEKVYIAMDGTGVPMVSKETKGRRGKAADGKAHTREAKLGCVFTQTTLDSEGRPVRDDGSTTYVGVIETAEEFGKDLYAEVVRRGLEAARIKVVLGDGALWIWELAQEHFPGAVEILDLYHAREHLWKVARSLYDDDDKKQKAWVGRRIEELNRGNISSLLKALRRVVPAHEQTRKTLETEIEFFRKNRHRMRYDDFRTLGLFVGSGVVEAGCRTVIGQRLKESGMRWTVQGANAIISLRRCFISGEWEDYWASRATG